ncbi:secretory phospholipase A2 receptor-like isoform X2 [Myripristis murdjan]|uniref:secretory phospholipase A2 receptor-like isoform X2 n=1 Tax=Myripristis murdjan TaxID=586833 RepID=UPI001175D4A5|nr:secretory phospholipase A2 receptor-like isoform X2 [Myripristis murdjan]
MLIKLKMMKSCLLLLLLLVLVLGVAVCVVDSVLVRGLKYFETPLSWQDAQSSCRRNRDLALIRQAAELDGVSMTDYQAWTGLHRDSILRYWLWPNGLFLDHHYWANNGPHISEDCGLVAFFNRRFYGSSCSRFSFFFCETRLSPAPTEYVFIAQAKTWADAQLYCREHHGDLAEFSSSSSLDDAVIAYDFPVWTGLHRDGGEWRWSSGSSQFRQWGSQQPGAGDCVSISSIKKTMATQDCSARFPYLCYYDNLLLVKENKTWQEALEHCRDLEPLVRGDPDRYRNHRYDLASLQPGDEQLYATDRIGEATTDEVWAGLRFLAGQWLWVNVAQVSTVDLPRCPAETQRCAALAQQTGSWQARDCTERKNFLCYRK